MKQKYTGRAEFLERIKKPECPSIAVLSEELNIPKATLYAWSYIDKKRSFQTGMKKKTTNRTAIKKFSILASSDGLKGKELQDFCNTNGILLSWRDLALGAIEHSESGCADQKLYPGNLA